MFGASPLVCTSRESTSSTSSCGQQPKQCMVHAVLPSRLKRPDVVGSSLNLLGGVRSQCERDGQSAKAPVGHWAITRATLFLLHRGERRRRRRQATAGELGYVGISRPAVAQSHTSRTCQDPRDPRSLQRGPCASDGAGSAGLGTVRNLSQGPGASIVDALVGPSLGLLSSGWKGNADRRPHEKRASAERLKPSIGLARAVTGAWVM